MSCLIEIPVVPLSREAFAPSGEVIDEFSDSVHAEGGFKAMRPVGFSISPSTAPWTCRSFVTITRRWSSTSWSGISMSQNTGFH